MCEQAMRGSVRRYVERTESPGTPDSEGPRPVFMRCSPASVVRAGARWPGVPRPTGTPSETSLLAAIRFPGWSG